MCTALHGSVSECLLALLWGIVLIGGLIGTPAPAQTTSVSPEPPSTDTIQSDVGDPDPPSEATQRETAAPSEANESVGEQVIEWLLGIFILGPILVLLLGLLLAIPSSLLAVSLVMDGGCLRFLLFGLGWLFAVVYGVIVGGIIVGGILGLSFLIEPIVHVFLWGYPVAAWRVHKRFQSMPREQYRAWDQTLTGGALLGFGAGSVAGLLRSVGSGFGGFGGGSFGGGGASGSWSGASGAAGGASSTAAGGTSSATAGTAATTAAGGSSKAAAVATGAAPGVETKGSSRASSGASSSRGLWTRLRQWFQKFQWYHGLAFILVTLVFVPLGLGTMHALQDTEFFVFALVCVVGYSGYRFLRRNPDATKSALRSISSSWGGEASSSWS